MFVFVGRAAQPLPGATLDPGPVGQRHWKLDHALRTVVNAGGALADEHGLGTGRASNEKAFSDESLAYVVETLIDSRRSARDRSVYRSRRTRSSDGPVTSRWTSRPHQAAAVEVLQTFCFLKHTPIRA